MAKKAGRPPGSQNKVGKDQKEFIKGLLANTQEEFRNAFMYYAKQYDNNIEYRNNYNNLSFELSKMIVPKPVEIDATMNVDDFQVLLGQCTKWDDEQ